MSAHDTIPLPPKPFARVRLVGGAQHDKRTQPTLNVPLHWLLDWPRALDARAQIGHNSWPNARTTAPQFHCFYSPRRDFALAPSFKTPPHLREFDVHRSSSAVYSVHVLAIEQPDPAGAYRTLRHARVRVRDCGTRLTVPVAWLHGWQAELRVDARPRREWRCYFEDARLSVRVLRVPHLTRFAGTRQRAWYAVRVERVFEGVVDQPSESESEINTS